MSPNPARAELAVPGKAFLAGEYSVLERGQPALVLAVDLRLRASVRFSDLDLSSLRLGSRV